MDLNGRFTLHVHPIDATDQFVAIIDWGEGNISVVKGNFKSHHVAHQAGLTQAAIIIQSKFRPI